MKIKLFILATLCSLSVMAQYGSASSWDFSVLNEVSLDKSPKIKGPKRTSSFIQMGGIGFGFLNTVGAPADMRTNMSSSMEVFFDLFSYGRKYNYGRHVVSFGMGLSWKNYRMTGYNRFDKDGMNVVISPYPLDAEIDFSRLRIFSLTFPLEYKFKIHNDFAVSTAAILHWNVDGSLKTKYKVNSHKVTEKVGKVNYHGASVDFRVALHWRFVSTYFKYSPCNVLKSEYGPQFNAFSAGVMFAM